MSNVILVTGMLKLSQHDLSSLCVPGSNSGVGFELVRLLAQMGHIVYLGARNIVLGKEALWVIRLLFFIISTHNSHNF